ncbi:hypothetical protein M798_05085 [Brucella melitensis ADMAS-G1]|nr:hypothetical protein M798_05085 [Brucella melitensis ADMAS-G1]
MDQMRKRAQKRCLASAVAANQCYDFRFLDMKIKITNDRQLTIASR